MTDINLIYIIFIFLVLLQSMAGVGVLVLGTPMMLLMEYNMVYILSYLLPISILTSLGNFLYFKIKKKKMKIKIDKDIKKFLFLACFPTIIFGLFILKNFEQYINFNLLVSLIIFFSIFSIINFKNIIFKFNKLFKIISLIFVGFIHGLTNSGGTLLSLVVSALHKNKINQSRYNTTFAYLVLALFQYLSFLAIFNVEYNLDIFKVFLIIVFVGVTLGNILIKFVNEIIYKSIINLLAMVSAVFLIVKM